jgi:N-acetylneuraminate synthase
LEKINVPAYKIASFELTDLPLIQRVAATRKPLIMSTGMASELEIEEAVDAARQNGCQELVLLHCISSYPAPINEANLRQISILNKRFNTLVGLSDHTLTNAASVAAVALGACVIEKHFTLSRADKGPDSEFSIEPNELEQLCQDTKSAWLALGQGGFERQKSEEGSRCFRRSLYFVNDLSAGNKITKNDIRRIRPGFGLPPKYFDSLIGRTVRVDVKKGMAVRWEFFNE